MAKTHRIQTQPLSGTQIAPVRNYTDEQKGKIKALGEVSGGNSVADIWHWA